MERGAFCCTTPGILQLIRRRFNTGEKPVISKNGLLTTVAYAFPGQSPVYALEGKFPPNMWLMIGSIAVAGSAVKWARDQLGIIKSSDEIGQLASRVEGFHIPYPATENRHCGCCLYYCLRGIIRSILEK